MVQGAIPETEELARLHRFESKQLTGFCVGEHLRVTPDSSTRPLVQLRVDQPLGREKHVPHARRTKTIPIHDCRPLVAPKPLQFVQTFSAGKLELNYGRPGTYLRHQLASQLAKGELILFSPRSPPVGGFTSSVHRECPPGRVVRPAVEEHQYRPAGVVPGVPRLWSPPRFEATHVPRLQRHRHGHAIPRPVYWPGPHRGRG